MAEPSSPSSADELLITRLPPPLRPTLVERPRLRACPEPAFAFALVALAHAAEDWPQA